MDFARDNVRRAIVVNRGALPSAPPPQGLPAPRPVLRPASPPAPVSMAAMHNLGLQHHLSWPRLRAPVHAMPTRHGGAASAARPLLSQLSPGSSACSPSSSLGSSLGSSISPRSSSSSPPRRVPPRRQPPRMPPPASSPVRLPLGPFFPRRQAGLERAPGSPSASGPLAATAWPALPDPECSRPEMPVWSWQSGGLCGLGQDGLQDGLRQGQQRQQRREVPLPSFGARTEAACASSVSDVAGSLGSMGSLPAALASSPPSPPGASDVDALALAMAQLKGSCGWMQPPLQQLGRNPKIQKNKQRKSGKFCAFCKGNGELPRMFLSHDLHTELPDGTVIVTCDVLRNLKCELCGASGDIAHTRSHCPFNSQPSVAVLLKNTPRRCDGTLRRKK